MPAGAELMTELKASLDCDDGYIAYINGTEVGRDQVDSTEYSAFSKGTNMGEKDAVWTFPAGTLVEGENVIAVEVHQCNATSTDAWWDLALSYAASGNVEGGISVPPTGLSLAIAVSKDGEWGPLSTLSVKGEMPKSTPEEGLRLAAALTAALDGDDTLDYLVVTNVAAGEIKLDGVKIVAWNAKKNTEAKPSLTYIFPAGASLLPGASLKIEASAFPAGGKLTNSQVGLRIYSAENTLVQDVYLDAGWWNSACDETGVYFVAKTFGAEAKTVSDEKSVTYEYYQSNIKPKPAVAKEEKGGVKKWVCKVCGYVHEGEELPADFVCPWCKHPASDFEPVA
jgi:rubredoxin